MGSRAKRAAGLVAVVLVLLAAGLAWQRQRVLCWYYTRQLLAATEQDRQTWLERLTGLDEAAVPGLVESLVGAEAAGCANAGAALAALSERWGPEDPRCLHLAERLHAEFRRCRLDGQRAALQVLTAILAQKGPPRLPVALTRAAGEVLHEARQLQELRGPVLNLAGALVERVAPGQWRHVCRALAEQGLADPDADTRVAAVLLVRAEPMRQDQELLARLIPLLRDPAPAVRRAAVVALAPARDLVREDALLPLLHDPDLEVQEVCEVALRSRGLDDGQILLARLISDEDPGARLRVVQHLGRQADLEPGVWLRRLSQDRAAAVRAAAVRAAGLYPQVDLSDRLREMASRDPSETVRQNAQFYLRQRSRPAPN